LTIDSRLVLHSNSAVARRSFLRKTCLVNRLLVESLDFQ
jgi:hypothetical protein